MLSSNSWAVLAVGVVVACTPGSRQVGGPTSGDLPDLPDSPDSPGAQSGDLPGAGTPLVAKAHLSLDIAHPNRRDPAAAEVTLVITDETGATSRRNVGEFRGPCTDVSDAERQGVRPVLAVRCEGPGERGSLLHLAVNRGQLSILRDWLDDSEQAFDELRRIELPTGAKVTAD